MISALLQTLANFGFDVSALNAAFNTALMSIQNGGSGLSSLGRSGLSGILGGSASSLGQGGILGILTQAFTDITGIDDAGMAAIFTGLYDAVSSIVSSGSAQAAMNAITGA